MARRREETVLFKKTVGIDIDGVIRDPYTTLRRTYKKHHRGHRVPPVSKWHDWDLSKFFPIGKKIYPFWFKQHPREIYLKARAYPGAIKFLRQLRKIGYEVWIVTAQPHGLEHLTIQWLQRHRVPYDHIAFTSDKSMVKCSVLLDDGQHNLDESARSTYTTGVCMDRPWNQNWRGLRVEKFDEFIGLLQTLV